jgi:predicted alpha/beta superfamily hydrolase
MQSRTRASIVYLVVAILAGVATAATAEDTVEIELIVTAPATTPADAKLYLSGSLPAAGNWKADGVALEKQADGRWRVKLQLPKARELQYKLTLGSWAGVEKGKAGEEIANRVLRADSDRRVEIAVQQWADPRGQPAAGRQHTLTGNLKFHRAFASTHLNAKRDVIVYLPPGYDDPASAQQRYPVLYMHDGQNLFDAATSFGGAEWRLDETAGKLIEQGKIAPLIIVGIANTADRMTEYTYGAGDKAKGKSGEDYLRFVIEELKPFIDKTYRTNPDRKNTAVGGSSLGGLISLYMVSSRPDVFSKGAVVSPALFWDNARAIREVAGHAPYPKDTKFWLDIGTREGRIVPDAGVGAPTLDCRKLVAEFDKAGLVEDVNYKYVEVEGATHDERHWAERADQMLIYLFGK